MCNVGYYLYMDTNQELRKLEDEALDATPGSPEALTACKALNAFQATNSTKIRREDARIARAEATRSNR